MASNSITDIRNANCVYVQGTTSDCGVSGYSPAGKDVNVSYHFGVLLRYGLAVFIVKAIFFAAHIVRPQRKIAAAKGTTGSILFLAWVIALSSWRFSDPGNCCSGRGP